MKKMSSNVVVLNGNVYYLTAKESQEILELLGIVLDPKIEAQIKSKESRSTKVAEPKPNTKTKESTPSLVVGSLEQSGKYVRTVPKTFLSKAARYAIRMAAEGMGATKLGKGNSVYDKVVKEDKYVQVYEFKSKEDATKFMDEQKKRLSK